MTLLKWRLHIGATQRRAAQLLSVSISTIRKIEQGRYTSPQLKKLVETTIENYLELERAFDAAMEGN